MATSRHYIDHDDTKPREKNEYYEVREYNVKEKKHGRYWRQSGKPTEYQDLTHLYKNRNRKKINDNWWTVIGITIGATIFTIIFLLKKACGIA